eukprot:CAMPEP_0202903740 /NCGR_PEP_ID=MMETSP1392-20130828/26080_1 /ASSEMBLY_ACC=CAM_ASM_000868 /TAXON_ID=225041 /ORGANISM="Chlamydomonas chlamydogama, Strain SAG 11-48b" /LENGTH=189 /DNA_ID=CAMNT_0049591061 /DNA_START=136 /DNA_END=705 /DNA_ORIENTATION=-
MDTVVVDPFFDHMPKFFGMTFQELMKAKHPTAWVEFETNLITEGELFQKFFHDSRTFDGEGLRSMMIRQYEYVDGMESLLGRLRGKGYELHAMSNYPMWFRYIEDKLRVSQYLDWTFVSCTGPMEGFRKPAKEAYEAAISTLKMPAGELLFVDDRKVNVDAALASGMDAVLFENAHQLEAELKARGIAL